MGRRPAAERGQLPAGPHRILWPGELARLRDSKVLARSLRRAARARPPLPPPSSFSTSWPLRSPAAAAAWDGVPCFLGPVAARGTMRYPLRKKLTAARAVVFLPPPEVAEAFVDAFAPSPPADVVAAH